MESSILNSLLGREGELDAARVALIGPLGSGRPIRQAGRGGWVNAPDSRLITVRIPPPRRESYRRCREAECMNDVSNETKRNVNDH